MSSPRVAVVGASGAVGRTMLEVLAEREFPASEIIALASSRSAGQTVGGHEIVDIEKADLGGIDLALFSAGSSVSSEWGPRFAEAGATVVDNSSYWRMDPDVPLVIAEVNPEALAGLDAPNAKGIVANPNCSTMQMLVALAPLQADPGIERIVVSTYQATSGTGVKAMDELREQAHAILHDQQPEAPSIYPHRIAFNVLPQVETFKDGDDYTTEERKMVAETRKILGVPEMRVSATCARVPVFYGHSQSVNVELAQDRSPDDVRELLRTAPGVTIVDAPGQGIYPLASDVAGRDDVLVGRIRRDPSNDNTVNMWIVGDNLRKGAATNAVQLAELLAAK